MLLCSDSTSEMNCEFVLSIEEKEKNQQCYIHLVSTNHHKQHILSIKEYTETGYMKFHIGAN